VHIAKKSNFRINLKATISELMSKIPVYFMPGLAASSTIFERINLDESVFEMCLLEWEIPQLKESLSDYALRITKNIKHENPVLIGVSFGGILVQEMAKHIDVRKVIIISSVRSNLESGKVFLWRKSQQTNKII
jgi:pimeloyl-ACP methyl ester carboxylesterase